MMTGSYALSIILFLSFSVMIDWTGHALNSNKPYSPDLTVLRKIMRLFCRRSLCREQRGVIVLTNNQIEKYNESIFENIKHVNEYGQEFWYARELQEVLEYSQWRYFEGVISKAIEACESSEILVEDHFAEVRKMVPLGSGAEREYACDW